MKYKEGDIVKIIACRNGHQFELGEEVRITKVRDVDYKAEYLDGHDYWFVEDEEIKLISGTNELQQKIEKAIKIIENDTDLNSQRQRNRLVEILKGNPDFDRKKEIEQINMKYYYDEPANICDLAHKVHELIDEVNKLRKEEINE